MPPLMIPGYGIGLVGNLTDRAIRRDYEQFGGELVLTVPKSTWNVLKSVRLIQSS